MHLSSLCLAACLSTAASFTVQPIGNVGGTSSRNRHQSSRMDQGWDNDDFLGALGGGQKSRDDANAKYQQESANRAAMRQSRLQSMVGNGEDMDDGTAAVFGAQVPGAPEKLPPIQAIDEDNPMGGEMFRQMMEKAKQGKNIPTAATGSSYDYQQPPQQAIPPPAPVPQFQPPPPQPAAAVPAQPGADALAYYQQQVQAWQALVNAYTQLCATDPQAAAQMTPPPPPPPPPQMQQSIAATAPPSPPQYQAAPAAVPPPPQPQVDPNQPINPLDYVPKGGGNRDAYEITNPADVYLAQLKRDSQVRIKARKEGDLDTANKPFADIGVKAIGTILSDELIASRRESLAKNGGEFETSRDEMLIPYEEDEEVVDKSYTGVSYKQKLEEMQRKRGMIG